MSESFKGAMAEMREKVASPYWTNMADRLQKTHEHEMEQLRRSRFREGYEAGQRSMDAAHYLLKLRLQGLRFGDSSHENLNRLAYAIYPCPTGWGKESCEGVRDKLIELLGGVHDEPAPIPASRCACDADCDCGNQQPQVVAYDSLGNERHKVVCELRKFDPIIGSKPTEEASKLIRCITGKSDSHVACGNDLEETRDRLIHLLGGDECNFSVGKNYMDDMGEKSNPAETSDTSTGHVILDTPLPEDETSHNDNGTCPNDDPTSSITDELRKFKGHINAGLTPEMVLALRAEINCIADRIDEQFNRICWQQEAVLQSTIDTMVDERDELRTMLTEQRDEARAKVLKLDNEVSDLLDLLRDAVVDFEYASYSWNYALIVGENITIETERNSLLKERDELRKELEDTRAALNRAAGRWAKARERERELRERLDEYEHRDTAEDIVRDIHLGKVTDSQAVERIRELR